MTQKEAKLWMEVKYPATIVNDRYGGCYSGGRWVAFPLAQEEIPEEAMGEDVECARFWDGYNEPFGLGAWPDEAWDNLIYEIQARAEGMVYD